MTDDNNIGLSRRRVLGGLGAIGIASAGAGIGTTAYFSDQENFLGNTLTAGTLAVSVTQRIKNVDQDGIGPDEQAWSDAGEGEAVVTTDPIVIEDAKPGDSYEVCWEVELEGNPGFAKATVDDVTDETGAEVGTVSASDLYDVDDDDDMVTIGEAADAVATLTLCDEDTGEPTGDVLEIFSGSLGDLLSTLAAGLAVPSDEDAFCHDTECPVELCVEIDIPTGVGNELQGASSSFDLSVYAEQCRHNDLASFLGQEAETELGEGFLTVEEPSMSARGRFGDGGGPQTWEVAIWESSMTDDDANYPWESGVQVPFGFEYDGDADVSRFDLGGVEVTASGGEPQGRLGIQTKADQSTIEVENLELVDADGLPIALAGPDGVAASNVGSGRELRYLVANTDPVLLANGFALSGDVTVTLEGDYDTSNEEGVAFDVVIE